MIRRGEPGGAARNSARIARQELGAGQLCSGCAQEQVPEPVSRRMSRNPHSTILDIEFGETAVLHAGPVYPCRQRATYN